MKSWTTKNKYRLNIFEKKNRKWKIHQNIHDDQSDTQTILKCLDTIEKIVYKSYRMLVKWAYIH